ncbi:MAG: transcriptional repressor LexA [Candidatus Latescibacteria bacterium]|nr:transcriptional repressor LexA [Candidatus Latescibacterota bacterium]
MSRQMTKRQQAIFDFIANTIKARGAPPTIREIMEAFDINSTNGVRTTLAALEKKGHIRRHARLSRGIELVDYVEDEPLSADISEIPLIGRVAAGEPILATQNIESTLQVDKSLVPASGTVFALRVHGESMKDAGILDGDIVLARQQEQAERGDIIVALIDEDATVKRYSPDADGVRLLPENDAFEPILIAPDADNFRIAGKVVGLMRRF